MIDPTYVKAVIDSDPVWKRAFKLSELENDEAPIGWSKYIPRALAELHTAGMEAIDIVRAILYASDDCQGHRGCAHSMEPWQRARKLIYKLDDGPQPEDTDA